MSQISDQRGIMHNRTSYSSGKLQERRCRITCSSGAHLGRVEGGGWLPQSEFPVAGSVGVPLGEWHHPALEPWALDNVVGERRSGHGD
jgi:hypothetical protein